jgi:hypothetical protein
MRFLIQVIKGKHPLRTRSRLALPIREPGDWPARPGRRLFLTPHPPAPHHSYATTRIHRRARMTEIPRIQFNETSLSPRPSSPRLHLRKLWTKACWFGSTKQQLLPGQDWEAEFSEVVEQT